jgi:hypothetical protein
VPTCGDGQTSAGGDGEERELGPVVGWARIGAISDLRACGESPVELGESEREAA